MIDETIKALPDGKRMAYVEGHIADYLLAGFTTDDLKALVAEVEKQIAIQGRR